MSSLGFQLVYDILGRQDDLVCERFFLPEKNNELRSVESGSTLSSFPLIFISISFEHDYHHLARMLLMAGIEPYADKRDPQISTSAPLIIGGGVAAFMNPEPFAPFIDLFLIGEAEPLLEDVTRTLVSCYTEKSRDELLRELAVQSESCYVPSFYTPFYSEDGSFSGYQTEPDIPKRVKRAYVEHTDVASHSQLTTPHAEFSRMHLTELGRGCSRGCRFCAAGFIYRPPRLWDGDAIVEGIGARHENVERVGLLGMEMAEMDSIDLISDYLKESGCALSFSSLRADRLSEPLLNLLSESGLKSVAIAPDGASERLRRVINKGLKESDLLNAAEKLVENSIFKLKLYLMIGLPTETDEDLMEGVLLIKKMKERIDIIGKERGRLTEIVVSVNCFAPKPWTPFQYHPFGLAAPLEPGGFGDSKEVVRDLKRKQRFLKNNLADTANVHIQFDKVENVLFQAVLSRGDRRLAPVLLQMGATGCSWKQAMKREKLTAEQFAICGYGDKSEFSWYIIDHGLDAAYLWQEYKQAFNEKITIPCDTKICRRCGVCRD